MWSGSQLALRVEEPASRPQLLVGHWSYPDRREDLDDYCTVSLLLRFMALIVKRANVTNGTFRGTKINSTCRHYFHSCAQMIRNATPTEKPSIRLASIIHRGNV
jgi:hypothetical protein